MLVANLVEIKRVVFSTALHTDRRFIKNTLSSGDAKLDITTKISTLIFL